MYQDFDCPDLFFGRLSADGDKLPRMGEVVPLGMRDDGSNNHVSPSTGLFSQAHLRGTDAAQQIFKNASLSEKIEGAVNPFGKTFFTFLQSGLLLHAQANALFQVVRGGDGVD